MFLSRVLRRNILQTLTVKADSLKDDYFYFVAIPASAYRYEDALPANLALQREESILLDLALAPENADLRVPTISSSSE
jgi:hypothetical protein